MTTPNSQEYIPIERGVTWSVGYLEFQWDRNQWEYTRGEYKYILHNLKEWQARAIASILNH